MNALEMSCKLEIAQIPDSRLKHDFHITFGLVLMRNKILKVNTFVEGGEGGGSLMSNL